MYVSFPLWPSSCSQTFIFRVNIHTLHEGRNHLFYRFPALPSRITLFTLASCFLIGFSYWLPSIYSSAVKVTHKDCGKLCQWKQHLRSGYCVFQCEMFIINISFRVNRFKRAKTWNRFFFMSTPKPVFFRSFY